MPRRPKASAAAKKKSAPAGKQPAQAAGPQTPLRIIGGSMRGRRILYSGEKRTRPMKDRLREAAFNLISDDVRGKHAIDLFAGTGALALEAVSRGAQRATLVEQHFPTAQIIRESIAQLQVEAQCQVVAGNTFIWVKTKPDLGTAPWLVFCSPPYAFYAERTAEMLQMLAALLTAAPPESIFVVEADAAFDFGLLPDPDRWDVRPYPPAVLGIYRKRDPNP